MFLLSSLVPTGDGWGHCFYCLCLVCVGWDMICNIVTRIISLASKRLLSREQLAFYTNEFLSRFVADEFHINKHKCIMCSSNEETGLFHLRLKKHRSRLRSKNKGQHNNSSANLNIAEQMWVAFNKMRFMQNLDRQNYCLMMQLFGEHVNMQRKSQLINEGWVFVPIYEFQNSQLRKYHARTHSLSDMPTIEQIRGL